MRSDELVCDLNQKGLKILRRTSAPFFSIDAVLLAHFAAPRPDSRAIELCAGSGVISLLLADRCAGLKIDALELLPEMAELAARSVQLNGLDERIVVRCGDVRQATQYYGRAVFDLALANPPYYKAGEGKISSDPQRAAARCESFCPPDALLEQTAALLKPGGRFCLIHRAERLQEILALAERHGLHAGRLRLVQPFAARAANLFLLELTRQGQEKLVVAPPLIVYREPGVYSAEMAAIYDGRADQL